MVSLYSLEWGLSQEKVLEGACPKTTLKDGKERTGYSTPWMSGAIAVFLETKREKQENQH